MHPMKTQWSVVLSLVFGLCAPNTVGRGLENSTQPSHEETTNFPRRPCPDIQDIYPCECSYDEYEYFGMTIDCSDVESEDQLRAIFNKEFPFTSFRSLSIYDNRYLKVLRKGDLGNCTFMSLSVSNSELGEIEDLALVGSRDTLVSVYVDNNKLTALPDISVFSRMETLFARDNNLAEFPILESMTLSELYLDSNSINEVPVDAIKALPNLQTLFLSNNFITTIESETFTTNENLSTLALNSNKLTTLGEDTLVLYGNQTTLYLFDNQITHLSYDAVSSVTGTLNLDNNLMKKLPEVVFRPLIEEDVKVFLEGNPFLCGCDIAWLILDRPLLEQLVYADGSYDSNPRCSDGEYFIDLNERPYEEMCSLIKLSKKD